MLEWLFSLATLPAAAADLQQQFADRKVFAFHAAMGAGKTTFIHAFCNALQVSSTVSSPTFSIIQAYNSKEGTVYHIDLYRLKDEEEAVRAGVEECLYSGDVCLVEWAEKAPGLFPPQTVHVYLEAIDSQTRRMRVADK